MNECVLEAEKDNACVLLGGLHIPRGTLARASRAVRGSGGLWDGDYPREALPSEEQGHVRTARVLIKTAVLGVIVMVGVVLLNCGCSSYRFQGSAPVTVSAPASGATKYRIDSVVFKAQRRRLLDGQSASDPWSVPTAAEAMSEDAIGRSVMRCKTGLFSSAGESVPVALVIRAYSEPMEAGVSMFLPYFVSLGLLPVRFSTPSHCDITVMIVGDHSVRQSCVVKWRADAKMSVFTPIGMIPFDIVEGAASCRSGNGMLTAPHLDQACGADRSEVFIETLAKGVEVCIREIEKTTTPSILDQFASDPDDDLDSPGVMQRIMLRRLDVLKNKGVLTEQEYEAKRKTWVKYL